ncbi:MAG: hypothetical protein GY839_02045 [candidate division Zixibacteria bacterium]|nr:hypothetical protein [candidate division Zixibacteria bacterium]
MAKLLVFKVMADVAIRFLKAGRTIMAPYLRWLKDDDEGLRGSKNLLDKLNPGAKAVSESDIPDDASNYSGPLSQDASSMENPFLTTSTKFDVGNNVPNNLIKKVENIHIALGYGDDAIPIKFLYDNLYYSKSTIRKCLDDFKWYLDKRNIKIKYE